MVVLDATIVNIALPSAQADLGFSDDQRQWVVTSYAITFGSLLLLGGRLADKFGRRRAFLIGQIGFAAASAVGGAAATFGILVTARSLQGVFAALLAPAALSLLTTTFSAPAERGKAFGVFGSLAASGGAVGLLLGGFLTEHLSWRSTMYVNLLFAAVAVVGGVLLLKRPAPTTPPRLDLPGTLLASSGLFCLVYGLAKAARTAGSPCTPWASWPPPPSCSPRSSGGRGGVRTRCCRCGSCSTGSGVRRSRPCSSPGSACSACSCS